MKNANYTPRLKKFALVSALTIGAAGLVAGALPGTLSETFATPIARIFFAQPAPAPVAIAPAQNAVPIVSTDKTGYLAGEEIVITAAGFLPGEAVTINLSRANGEPVQTWNVAADANGQAIATWAIDPNDRGVNDFLVVAEGPSGTSQTEFSRIAVIHPNKFKFEPGEAVFVRGAGFRPGEDVLLEITRVNLDGTNTPKEPFYLTADQTGGINAEWAVDPQDADGAIYRMVARGITSSVMDASVLGTGSTFLENPVTLNLISDPVLDDGGPDDFSGQKDLNQLQEDDGPTDFGIAWNWDDIAWTGNNTGDACALIDTDQDGNANYAFCVFVKGKPAVYAGDMFYSCGDTRADRCDQPVVEITDHSSIANAGIVPDSDPFRLFPSHQTGNVCNDTPSGTFTYDCRNDDTVANVTIQKADLGSAVDPRVVNVCSYPSGQPNSAPSDCVFNPQNGFLVIQKVADPNDQTTAFIFNASRQSQTGLTQWTIYGSGTTGVISYSSTATVNLTEVVPSTWSLDSASCSINTATPTSTGTFAGTSITGIAIQPGLTTTCTFNNSLQTGTLIVEKVVVNDDGGTATVEDFSFQVDGGTAIPFEADGSNSMTMEAGTYNVTEPAFTGYSTTYNNCTNVVVPAGGTATCTITNDDQAATLIVKKIVVNDDGGNAVANDFTFQVNGGSPVTFEADGQNDLTVDAGTYSVVEPAVTGYAATYDNCSNLVIPNGGTATCTITNDDVASTLTLVKNVVNDDGGNALPNDFLLTIGGSPATSGVAYTLDANTAYAINETQLSGYSFVDITGDAKCPAVLGGTVTLDEGENVTCTITNNDIAPQLRIVKTVNNDDGGNLAVSDFPLFIDGNAVTSGSYINVTANAVHTATETSQAGYTPSAWGGDCAADGTITLNEGDMKTCTITNDDVAPTLKLVKAVINDNGGTNDADDWTLSAAAGAPYDGRNFSTAGGSGVFETVFANNAYNLSESAVPGYSASSWSCTGGTLVGSSLTLEVGETNVTCTITNNDIAPQLTVIKHVVNDNGGTAEASHFTLDSGGLNDTPSNFAGAESPGTIVTLDAGPYNVNEFGPAGYAASFSADCSGTIAVGEIKTCTVINNDIAPTLTVIKYLNPAEDNGLFNLLIDSVPYALNVGHSGTTGLIPLNAGVHTVSESAGTGTDLSNYISLIGGDCGSNGLVSLALAENKVCTITNTRKASLVIVKNTEGGNATFDFTSVALGNFSLTTVSNTASATLSNLDPGTFDVAESPKEGWDPLSATCSDGSDPSSIGLSPGETVTCTFTNRARGRVNVLKTVNGSPDPDLEVLFRLSEGENILETLPTLEDADGMLNFTTDLVPGTTYTMCEVGIPAGFGFTWAFNTEPVTPYNPDDPSDYRNRCHDFSVTAGQTAEFAVNNTQPLLVTKNAATLYTRTHTWDIAKAASPALWNMFKGDSGTTEYTVSVTRTGFNDSGWAVNGTITIMNPSKVAATIESVTDVVSDAGAATVDCGVSFPYTLAAEASLTCTYQAGLPDATSRTNTATVVTSGPVPGGSGNAAVTFGDPTTLVNDSINVTDTNGMSWQFGDSGLVNYTRTFACNANEGTHINTATIVATDQSADASVEVNCYDLSVSKTAQTSLTRTYEWTIDKSVDNNSFDLFKGETGTANYTVAVDKTTTDSDWKVSGNISIYNPAPVGAYLSDITDVISPAINAELNCSLSLQGASAVGYYVPPYSTYLCTYEALLPDDSGRMNTATAKLQNFTYSPSGDSTPGDTTDFTGNAAVSFASAAVNVVGFDTVNVTDTIGGDLGTTSEDITWTYPDSYTCGEGTYNRQNTATIIETDLSDTESVTYNCYELQVAKTAAATFSRSWNWTIVKGADTSALTLSVGQEAAVNYTVGLNATPADTGWAANGTITVTNPNPAANADVTVTDVMSGGVNAAVTCTSSTVPAAGNITCTYTAALPDGTDRTNTATVTHGTFATYTADALVDFGQPTTEIDEAVNVSDDLHGTLGTVTAPAGIPGTFNYTRTVGGYLMCGNYNVPNTASFVTNDTGTTGSEGHNVTVTVPCGTILVEKVVLSPNAGDTPDDFSYTFNGGSPITFLANGTSPTTHVVNPGIYTIAEPVTNGFVASYSGDCNAQGQITAVGGETKTCTITNVYLTGFVTSSSLCTFDVDGDDTNGNQFRLLLTPDVQLGYNIYKLNASNPGQYYYNVLHYNPGSEPETVTLTIPFPFVTQGATPLHVYGSVTTQVNGSSVCLLPGTELFNQQSIIELAGYVGTGTFGDTQTVSVSVPPGFTYINIHLDYGLKRTTNYLRGASDVADNQSNDLWDIINGQEYTFSNGGTQTVNSVNEFKKNPGIAGLTVTAEEEPIPGSQIELWLGTSKKVGTTATDADGWYQIYYKHLGKAQTFYVKWINNGRVIATKQVQLKANGFAEVSFP